MSITLAQAISRRKSFRKYENRPLDAADLAAMEVFLAGAQPLVPQLKIHWTLLDRKQVKCILPWLPPQILSICTEPGERDLENVGFMFQQLDLWLQARGLGACWLGMGQPDRGAAAAAPAGMEFAMMLAIGYPRDEALRPGPEAFRRKRPEQIADQADRRLEPARLAPSSINSQPWYFVHEGDVLHVYCVKQGLGKAKAPGAMNRIDVGICLAHLYVCSPDTFRFFSADAPPVKGYGYISSITF